jgi:hypothetical protein
MNKTGLCWDIILQIAEYLSSNEFIKMILQRINSQQIVSLSLNPFSNQLKTKNKRNSTIKYFYLDMNQFLLTSMMSCSDRPNSYFLNTFFHLIKSMKNIEYVHLNTNDSTIKKLLDINEWKSLVRECHQLKKITLNVLGSVLQDQQLIQKALQIQKKLCQIREKIAFEINLL